MRSTAADEPAAPVAVSLDPHRQWLARILDEYRDEHTKQACDACPECGALVMCRFHSLLSLLTGQTFIDEALARLRGEATVRVEE